MSHDVSHVVASWPTLQHTVHQLCVYALTVEKLHPRCLDPVVGGAQTFRKFQRGAVTWREKRAHVFSKVRTHHLGIHQSID